MVVVFSIVDSIIEDGLLVVGIVGVTGSTIADCYLIQRRFASEAALRCSHQSMTLCSPNRDIKGKIKGKG